MKFHFSKEQLSDFRANIRREWMMANGIGGYSGGSVTGAQNRTHQGYLIASLHPPVERFLVFSKTSERFRQDGILYDLETSQHAGEVIGQTVVSAADVPDAYKTEGAAAVAYDFPTRRPVYREGNRYLEGFTFDGTVCFSYRAGALSFQKRIAAVRGENAAAVAYEFTNDGEEAEFTVTPFMNFREHSTSGTREQLSFTAEALGHGFTLVPQSRPDLVVYLGFSAGKLVERSEKYDEDLQLQTEVDNETPGLDCHFTPYDIVFSIPAHSTMKFSLLCRVETSKEAAVVPVTPESAFLAVDERKRALDALLLQAGYTDPFAQTLTLAADQFLARRESTGLMTVLAGFPWFTDWGRDTMIAFSGLVLSTKRFAEAREILATFAEYLHHGMVPNMFPDDGQEPLYNTADASLWYFYAVHQYLSYDKSEEALSFIRAKIYPALKQIIDAYRNGTDFSIYMDDDGLIHAGSGVDQVTWMDVRVGSWVVTPRHGKPVEINALWYNALSVMERLAERFGEESEGYRRLAGQVKESFTGKFWNEKDRCLYDVIDGDKKDASIRPNQIFAVSLPFTMLSEEQEKAVVDLVKEKLYAGCGLRSLSKEHPDYHPVYCGSLPKRDAAYHQGTAWGYLLGGFLTAYLKVYGHGSASIQQALDFLEPVKQHLSEGCIGSVSEIFDGEEPHTCRGCYAQAWSVGEILRCYAEDIRPYL